jgi:hypothetical protein
MEPQAGCENSFSLVLYTIVRILEILFIRNQYLFSVTVIICITARNTLVKFLCSFAPSVNYLQLDMFQLLHQSTAYSWICSSCSSSQFPSAGYVPVAPPVNCLQLDMFQLLHQLTAYSWICSSCSTSQLHTAGYVPVAPPVNCLQLDMFQLLHLSTAFSWICSSCSTSQLPSVYFFLLSLMCGS